MVNNYRIVFSKTAAKNVPNIKAANLTERVNKLLDVIREDPFRNPPPYEKLVGDMTGLYSRRINIKHRLVYKVYEEEKTVQIVSMWSHYEYGYEKPADKKSAGRFFNIVRGSCLRGREESFPYLCKHSQVPRPRRLSL